MKFVIKLFVALTMSGFFFSSAGYAIYQELIPFVNDSQYPITVVYSLNMDFIHADFCGKTTKLQTPKKTITISPGATYYAGVTTLPERFEKYKECIKSSMQGTVRVHIDRVLAGGQQWPIAENIDLTYAFADVSAVHFKVTKSQRLVELESEMVNADSIFNKYAELASFLPHVVSFNEPPYELLNLAVNEHRKGS